MNYTSDYESIASFYGSLYIFFERQRGRTNVRRLEVNSTFAWPENFGFAKLKNQVGNMFLHKYFTKIILISENFFVI